METFWRKGYTGTSLDDLARSCNMNRPSLYAAFGNKQQIYLSCLDQFAQHMTAAIQPILERQKPLEACLRAFYAGVIDVYFSGDSPARGCMVWCTAITEAHEEPEIRDYLDRALNQVDAMLAKRFATAIERGELPGKRDAALLGKLAAATMHSIALRARSGQSRASLKRLGDATAKMLATG